MVAQAPVDRTCCPVIELRQYTLKSGQRDTLIELFDRHFIESQEAAGMTVIGQFRDQERFDRFVWMRGFQDMASRRRGLEQFYGGPVWMAHRSAANETMLDSDNVLLLRPARPDMSLVIGRDHAAPRQTPTDILIGLYVLNQPADEALVAGFDRDIVPRLRAEGVNVQGAFVTESAPNTFTRLPVREGEHMFVWVATLARMPVSPEYLKEITNTSALDGTRASATLLHLEPTSRSCLGGGPHARRATKHDFDFLHGSWDVHNRSLKERMTHCTEWIEFDARSTVEPLLNGFGQLDRYSTVRARTRVEGITLRLFNPATGEWTLHWADTVRPGVLLPPMVGRFAGDVGEFFGEEAVGAKKVLCRFHWTRTPDGPRWEQGFSEDCGKTWETNWIMTFRRR
jgi:hypothetical protein